MDSNGRAGVAERAEASSLPAPVPASATPAAPAAQDDTRFGFGKNWRRFLAHLDDQRIAEAEESLRDMLGVETLEGKTFLDIGSGSGLSSLAAKRLGAARVHSFDYDPDSVACTQELKRRFFPEDEDWTIERGDATDPAFVSKLGTYDVVYSYGVLHHTGQMWRAIENATQAVAPGGLFWIALYNDLGWRSGYWRLIKRTYSRFPLTRPFLIGYFTVLNVARKAILSIAGGQPAEAYRYWFRAGGRGMTGWHDLIDWVGGYPYEVAKPEEIFDYGTKRGFELQRLVTVNTLGNNDFVFRRTGEAS
jgi:2-polyprenyl-6-hydroxyphenyl methylase/3-demethylubiquinone-9 3-methyltransferase